MIQDYYDLNRFRKGKDYLKFYVPGTSPLKSFMNLCDAYSKQTFIICSIHGPE